MNWLGIACEINCLIGLVFTIRHFRSIKDNSRSRGELIYFLLFSVCFAPSFFARYLAKRTWIKCFGE